MEKASGGRGRADMRCREKAPRRVSAWGWPLAVQVFLPAALDLGQDLVDHDVFRGGLAERGIQSVQQVGDAFRFAADQGYSRVFADRGQCSASDRRDFTDGDLTARRIEEGLDVLEATVRHGGAFR